MAELKTSIEINLIDKFSQKLKESLDPKLVQGFKDKLASLTEETNLTKLASQFSLISSQLQSTAASLKSWVEEPTKLFMNVQDSMASVNTVLTQSNAINGDIKKSYEVLQNSALEWSRTHSDSATKFINTSYNMLSAGLSTQEAIVATQKAMLLAKGTLADSTEAANLMAIVYNNMGKTLKDTQGNVLGMDDAMSKIADTLAKTQAQFQIANLGQLNEGLKYGIPVALQYGASLDQLSTIIGQLNTAGLQGSMAGTSFAAMMRNIIKAGQDLNFKVAYNIEGDESSGIDIIKTLQNIKEQFGEIDFSEQAQLQKAFGDEGLRGLTLLLNNLDSLQGAYKDIQNASGTAFEMASKKSDTLSEKLQILQNRKDALKVKIAELSQESNKNILSMSSVWLSFQEKILSNKIGQSLAVIGFSAANLGSSFIYATSGGVQFLASTFTIMSGLQKMGGVLSVFKSGLMIIPSIFSSLATSIISALPAIGAWITSVWTAAAAHIAAFWPIYAIIGAVALLAGGVYLIIKNWKAVSQFFVNLWNGIVDIFKKAFDFIWSGLLNNKFIQIALAVFAPFIGLPILIIKNWNNIVSFFQKLPSVFLGFGKSILNFILTPIRTVFEFLNSLKIKIPDWIPGLGGKTFGFNLPSIPTFAKGVENFSGGLAYVHSDELISLPRGSNIFTKMETQQLFNSSKSSSVNNYNITINVKHLVEKIDDLETAKDFIRILGEIAGVNLCF